MEKFFFNKIKIKIKKPLAETRRLSHMTHSILIDKRNYGTVNVSHYCNLEFVGSSHITILKKKDSI